MAKAVKHERIEWNRLVWVINNLPPADLELIAKKPAKELDLIAWLDEQIQSGGDVKFSWDDFGNCPSIKLMYSYEGFDNSGYAVSGRGEDFWHCLRIVHYKCTQVAQKGLSNLTEARDKPRFG